MKRFRRQKLKNGELRIYYGKLPFDSPDIVFEWNGDSSMKFDSRYLHYYLGCKKPNIKNKMTDYSDMQNSFFEELIARGYDIATLKFSIQKLKKQDEL